MANKRTSLADAFTLEHEEIDAGIEAYLQSASDDPSQRAQPLMGALEALRRHIYLEEEFVFPRLPAGPLTMALMVMYREHGELRREMDRLAASIETLASSNEVVATCQEILDLLERHNSKEEPIIYPYLDSDLSDEEKERIRGLLMRGTLPVGWVCREA